MSNQYDAHVRAARNSDRTPRRLAHTHVASCRARAVGSKCSLAGLTRAGGGAEAGGAGAGGGSGGGAGAGGTMVLWHLSDQ